MLETGEFNRKNRATAAGRQRKAYCRKLCIAHLITTARHDLLSLADATGMPRRTLQDCIADLGDIGIVCEFVQAGKRNHHGHYVIRDWGDHDPAWIATHFEQLLRELDLAQA